MITSINSSNRVEYNKLFSKAYDTLSGYKKVNKYDENIKAYYYKGTKPRYTSDFKPTQEGFDSGTYYIFKDEYEEIAIKSEADFLANRPLYKQYNDNKFLEVIKFQKEKNHYFRKKYVLVNPKEDIFNPRINKYYEKTLFYPFQNNEITNEHNFREQYIKQQIYIGIAFNQFKLVLNPNEKDFSNKKYYTYNASLKNYELATGNWDSRLQYYTRDFTEHTNAVNFKDRECVPGFSSDNPINTISDYFNYLDILKSVDIRFTFLPLEEKNSSYFNINANTREIEIPQSFIENGLGVIEDHNSEILNFVIDRYFDTLDLNSTNIYISWENAEGIFGRDLVTMRSVEIDSYGAEKILFAWPIPKELTLKEGKIKFSVQFFKKKKEITDLDGNLYTIKSQLNILPTSSTIKFTLSFPHPNSLEFKEHYESGYDLILSRQNNQI